MFQCNRLIHSKTDLWHLNQLKQVFAFAYGNVVKLSQWKEAGCMLKKKFCLMDTETWVVTKSTASKSVNLATWNCLWLHRSQEGVLAGSHPWWKHFITFSQRHNFSYFSFHKLLTCKRDTTAIIYKSWLVNDAYIVFLHLIIFLAAG